MRTEKRNDITYCLYRRQVSSFGAIFRQGTGKKSNVFSKSQGNFDSITLRIQTEDSPINIKKHLSTTAIPIKLYLNIIKRNRTSLQARKPKYSKKYCMTKALSFSYHIFDYKHVTKSYTKKLDSNFISKRLESDFTCGKLSHLTVFEILLSFLPRDLQLQHFATKSFLILNFHTNVQESKHL